MAQFKAEAGKVMSQDEVAKMLSYDNAGVARPEEYDDVVFDATGISGAVYRVKTAEQKKADEEAHAAGLESAKRAEKLAAEAEEYKVSLAQRGGDIATSPVNTGVRAVEGNTSVDGGGDPGPNTGGRAGTGTTTRR